MLFSALFVFALSSAPTAQACEGHDHCSCGSSTAATKKANPTHTAKASDLVGANCSYTTGMMAQRVLEQGSPYTFTGSLSASQNDLDSHVAAPFTVGPNDEIHVVANAVIEGLTETGADEGRVMLEGKLLEVDGTSYFVALRFVPPRA